MRRILTLAALCLAGLCLPATSSAATTGTERVLVISASYDGAPTFTLDQVRSDVAQLQAFLSSASFGKYTIQPDFTPMLQISWPSCPDRTGLGAIEDAAKAAAAAAGFDPTAYARFVLVGKLICDEPPPGSLDYKFSAAGPDVAWIDDPTRDPAILEAEVGRSLGLGYASLCFGFDVSNPPCQTFSWPGDLFNVMGGGFGDFNALQLAQLGWITPTTVVASGDYLLDPIEEPSTGGSLALFVPSTVGPISLEARARLGVDDVWAPWDYGTATVTVQVHPPAEEVQRYALDSLELAELSLGTRDPTTPSELTVPGLFHVSIDAAGGGRSLVHFTWLDHTPPNPPEINEKTSDRGTPTPTFYLASTEPDAPVASGVASYEAGFDGQPLAPSSDTVQPGAPLPIGPHTISSDAIDSAGNRSSATTLQFDVVGRPSVVVTVPCRAGTSIATACKVRSGSSQKVRVHGVGMPGGKLSVVIARLGSRGWQTIRSASAGVASDGSALVRVLPGRKGIWRVRISALAHGDYLAVTATRYLRARP
jgi:hypothetical protein